MVLHHLIRISPGIRFIQLCLLLLTASAALAADTRTMSVTRAFDPPKVELRDGRATVSVPGCATLFKVGEPVLPFRTARILIPPGYRVTTVTSQALGKPEILPGNWEVELGRLPTLASATNSAASPPGASGRSRRIPRPTTAILPAAQAQLIAVHRLLGHDVALVRLFPVQFASANGQLRFAPTLKIVLSLVPSGEKPGAGLPARGQAAARARVVGSVDNPELVSAYEAGQSDAPATLDYLVVTSAQLAPAFEPLVQHKIAQGLEAKVETLEDLTRSQPGRDAAEKLRNFIRQSVLERGVRYVLLGGDAGTVPCRYVYVYANEKESECQLPSDLYYACLDGSWNRDDDKRWGEPIDGERGDDVDLLAEVAVGRAPVDTLEEAAAFVAKTIRYAGQTRRPAPRVLLAAEYLGRFAPDLQAQGADMFQPLEPWLKDCSVRWLDDRPHTTPQWTGAQAIAALNDAPDFVLYNGHAQSDRFLRIGPGDLRSVTNRHLFVACSVGCHAGRFDNDPMSPDSIAEALVNLPEHGAVAGIFNARLGWFDPPQVWRYSGEFQAAWFARLLGRAPVRLGDAWQQAREELLGQIEIAGLMPYRWCAFEIALFGDPHLAVR